jgi:hypothetical protein
VKKSEIRALLQNIDKETAATVSYNEFIDMASPKVRVVWGVMWCGGRVQSGGLGRKIGRVVGWCETHETQHEKPDTSQSNATLK